MKQQQEIQIYDAIREMEILSQKGEDFSFSFVKYNREDRNGGDIAKISRAKLRKKTPDDVIAHSSYKLFYYDLDAHRPANCWQVLIIEFNGKKCIL